MKNKKNKYIFAGIFASGSAILITALAGLNVGKVWQNQFSNILYSGHELNKNIIVVNIDDKSLSDEEGLGSYDAWDRNNFAQVLENLNKHSPKVIAFDFFFQNEKTEEGDKRFQAALKQTKNPLIMYRGNPSKFDSKGYFVQSKDEDQSKYGFPTGIFLEPQNVVVTLAKIIGDEDGFIRKMLPALYNETEAKTTENIAFATARIFLDGVEAPQYPNVKNNHYVIGLQDGKNINIPLEDGQMLINYASVPNKTDYQNISFVDVYNENYTGINNDPEQFFKDKIVLVGPTAFFFKDQFKTPLSEKNLMSGIYLQANALQTILEQKFLRNLTFPEKAAIIIFLALTAAFTFMFTKIRYSLIYLFGVPLAYSLAAQPAFNAGVILDLVHPYLVIVAVFMAVYLYRYVTEFREKMALQSAFAKYVNPALAKQIAEHPETLKLGGESRDITVMFTDIAHSTTIEENLKPQSVVALLSEYFEAMSGVIMEEGGTVDKFEGDGIMALFGAPVAQPDHAVRAARAALKMRVKLAQLLDKWKTDPPLPGGEPKPQIDFRCGLSSGEATVGNMGSTQRFDYTALGDVVNLGSRLEGANKMFGTHIMMNKETYEKTKDYFEIRKLGKVKVIGKNQTVEIFEPIGPKGQLVEKDQQMLGQYAEALDLYYNKKFTEALAKFDEILKVFPDDQTSKLYRQHCEVLRDYPPPEGWDGSFELGSK